MTTDAFLQLTRRDGAPMKGESRDSGHVEEMEILSFSHLIDRGEVSGIVRNRQRIPDAVQHAITIVKLVDSLTPKLAMALCEKKSFATVKIILRGINLKNDSPNVDLFTIQLDRAHVSRIHYVGDARFHLFGNSNRYPVMGHDLSAMGPLEEIDLRYEAISWQYGKGDNKQTWPQA